MKRPLTLLIASLTICLLQQGGAWAQQLTAAQWRADLRFMVEQIAEVHPQPFGRISEDMFRAEVARLEREIPSMSRQQIVGRLMGIAALVEDGHTSLMPNGDHGFRKWFRIRFRDFPEGLFIVVVDNQHPELVGAQVLSINDVPAAEVLERAGSLVASDNAFGRRANAPLYLSNGDALAALGVLSDPDRLPIEARLASGEVVRIALEAVEAPFGDGWFWRIVRAPGGETVNPFTDDWPLHLRAQVGGGDAYFFEHLAESGVLYFQMNGWWDGNGETFLEFSRRLWDVYDRHEIETLVIDLRYNAGGNGAMFREMMVEIIRRPRLYEPGRLAVLTGGRTFSASINAIGAMLEWANISMVGTPMAAGLNMHGDNLSFVLPESGMDLYVSSLFWQAGFPADDRQVVSPHVPAIMTSQDFFAGRDPALEAVLSGNALSLADRFRRDGGKAALAAHRRLSARHTDLDWWIPFAERELNRLGYELAENGRPDDGRVAFLLNTETFPDAWNVWDSLGDFYMETGELEEAGKAYRRSVELNPGSESGKEALEDIAQQLSVEISPQP
jgi:hypothetical protein